MFKIKHIFYRASVNEIRQKTDLSAFGSLEKRYESENTTDE